MNNRKVKNIWQRKCPKLSFSETDGSLCVAMAMPLEFMFSSSFMPYNVIFPDFSFLFPTGLHSRSDLLQNSESSKVTDQQQLYFT